MCALFGRSLEDMSAGIMPRGREPSEAWRDGSLGREQSRKSTPRGFKVNLPVKLLAGTGTLSC